MVYEAKYCPFCGKKFGEERYDGKSICEECGPQFYIDHLLAYLNAVTHGKEVDGTNKMTTINRERNTCIEEDVELALKKQKPLKPTYINSLYGFKSRRCGACGYYGLPMNMKYCDQCGQKIDWEEDSDE